MIEDMRFTDAEIERFKRRDILRKSWEKKIQEQIEWSGFVSGDQWGKPYIPPTRWQRLKRSIRKLKDYRLRNPLQIPEDE